MSFSGKYDEAVYIILSINIRVGKDMDSGPYLCDVFDYSTGTWWNCEDEK